MKVVAINGSPHLKGNTYDMMQLAIKELKAEGISVSFHQLAPMKLQPCIACYKCAKAKDLHCHGGKEEKFNDLLDEIFAADGLIIGSPTWFGNVSGHVKNLIDRAGLVARMNGNSMKRKVGAAVVAVRRGGGVPAFEAINRFFMINEMVIPCSSYWNIAYGREGGECLKDEEGTATMTNLGQNMAWLLKKLSA